jgi:O-acetyl-ADP-ribose deacetylase (regulator of RNase III)
MKKFFTVEDDLLSAPRGFIIHGCNDKGVMGSGVAAGVRNRYPGAYAVYKQTEQLLGLKIGTCSFYQHNPELFIVNAVTQTLGGPNPLDMQGLAECFSKTLYMMSMHEYCSGISAGSLPLLFPMIGAGRAGGDWNEISDVIVKVTSSTSLALAVNRQLILYTVKAEPADCR